MSKLPTHLEDRESDGARLFSPTAARNSGPIADVIAPHLGFGDTVLEIASGTGQQAMAIIAAAPDIYWQPSDPDPAARASVASYIDEVPLCLFDPLDIDVTHPEWWVALPERNYSHIFCANMIHIAPETSVDGIAAGAAAILPNGGQVFLYGPFLFGADSAPSNLEFSARLKARHPDWGVREIDFVKHIFASHGLSLAEVLSMPANNHLLRFKNGN